MGSDAEVDELVGLPDVRTVSVIWSDGRPELIYSEIMSQFEAFGLLQAAVERLRSTIGGLIDYDDPDSDEDEEDDDDD